MYKDNIMTIVIPESWDDVTVNEYQALKELNREEYDGDLSYTNAILQVLCDIPTSEFLSLENLSKIMPHLKFLSTVPTTKKLKSFEYKGDSYSWIGDFGKMTVGEAISIEQIIDLEELTYDQSLDVVMAVLLRKEDEEFSGESFVKNRNDFGSLPISKVNGMLLFFLSGGTISIKNMVDYSIVTATKGKIIQKRSGKLRRLLHKLKNMELLINGLQWLTKSLKGIQRMTKLLMI